MLQVDGSRHDWLQGRGPYLSLVGAIDDATGTVPYALFRQQEDAQGYLLLLREIIHGKGMPLALYSDRHSIFQVNPQQGESLEDQLAGGRKPTTQVGRALQELGVQLIVALSPQAKGRIERLWGTFQDRLGRVHTKRSTSKMSANEMHPRKITSSFSKREKMRRNPFNRRNSLSISLRLLYTSRSYSHG